MLTNRWTSAVAATIVLVTAGCSARGAAESALTAADEAIASVQDEAAKVLPDSLAALTAAVSAARDQLAAGEFQMALDAAKAVPARVEALKAAMPAAREELTVAWNTLSEAMQRNLGDLKAKLDQYTGKSLPPGATAEQLEAARAGYAAAPEAWNAATAAWQSGDLAGAMGMGLALRGRVSEAMTTVGLVSDETAWGNARPMGPVPQ